MSQLIFIAKHPKVAVIEHNNQIILQPAETFCTNVSQQLQEWLYAYSQKKFLPPPSISVLEALSPFAKRVLDRIGTIKAGTTSFYHAILEHKRYARAVARACHFNPFPLFIPCHRVIGLNNKGGYRFGSELKFLLLDFEQSAARN